MDWQTLINEQARQAYWQKLQQKIQADRQCHTVYPKEEDVFRAFELTPLDEVKVVILGQDPYHNKQEANGLSFSVNKGVKIPPSLRNIFKELQSDLGIDPSNHGDLTRWARQGVLLLNTVLTVIENQPESHKQIGWEIFTDRCIDVVNQKNTPVIFVLWGKSAQHKQKRITNPIHHVITSAHPSPLAAYRGFFNSKVFSRINTYLKQDGFSPIDFSLDE